MILLNEGYGTLGSILFVVSLLFEAGAIFMFATYFAQKAADRAIQREHEQLWSQEKPKRVRLADDGEIELMIEDELEDQINENVYRG